MITRKLLLLENNTSCFIYDPTLMMTVGHNVKSSWTKAEYWHEVWFRHVGNPRKESGSPAVNDFIVSVFLHVSWPYINKKSELSTRFQSISKVDQSSSHECTFGQFLLGSSLFRFLYISPNPRILQLNSNSKFNENVFEKTLSLCVCSCHSFAKTRPEIKKIPKICWDFK